jgi:hypothetical protein
MPAAVRQQLPEMARHAAPPGHTAFGGGFVLLPILLSMPFDDWVRGWPAVAGMPPDRVLRALVLATCLGASRRMALLGDPVWCGLLGLPTEFDWAQAGAALGGLPPHALRAVRAGLAREARQAGDVPRIYKAVRAAGQVWGIDADAAGYWHRIMAVKAAQHRIVPDADVRYLAGGRAPWLPPAWQRLICLAAQQVLRRFARRLPGFALSHLDYLHANFLCMPASVELRGEQMVVGLGRPPLALMLDLAGMTRTAYTLPWHGERTVVLHVESA